MCEEYHELKAKIQREKIREEMFNIIENHYKKQKRKIFRK